MHRHVHRQPGVAGEPGARPDADRHHHEVGRDLAAVGERDRPDAALAEERLGGGAGDDADAAALELALQQVAGGGVELALHQGGHQVDHRHLHALLQEAGRGFQTEDATPDHGYFRPRTRMRDNAFDILERAQEIDAGKVRTKERRRVRRAAVGENAGVVGQLAALRQKRVLLDGIDADYPRFREQLDLILLVPTGLVVE